MNKDKCKFELSSINNFDEYFQIRSEKTNLYWTGYTKPPNYKNFKLWYHSRIKDKTKDLYLLFCQDKCIGSLNIDYYEKYAFIGYSVKEEFEKKGFATFMVNNAIKIVKKRGNISKIKAWINEKNIGSIKVVEKNGFEQSKIYEIRKRFKKEDKYLLFEINI